MLEQNHTISNLHQLLDYDARKFTAAEIQLKNSLVEWVSIAGSIQLKTVLQKYLDLVQQHVLSMEVFFEDEQIDSMSISNGVMHAYIFETNEKLSYCTEAAIKDASLLACIQSINHFKISAYGTAAAFANELGMESHAAIFHKAEINEKQIDDRLTQLAAFEINIKAKAPVELNG